MIVVAVSWLGICRMSHCPDVHALVVLANRIIAAAVA